MGSTFMGSVKHTGNAPLMTPEQQTWLQQLLQGQGAQGEALQQLLQGMNPEEMQKIFQQSFVDPAMMTYQNQVLPSIQQRFVGANAGSSSALNQALGQSAADLSTMLGSQMGQFAQGQQQNALQAIGIGNQATSQRAFDPIIRQRQGLAGPLISAAGSIGSAFLGGK